MSLTVRHTFKKNERVTSRREILQLVSRGHRIEAAPILSKYIAAEEKNVNKVMVIAPKKSFKRAVDRNLLKRRMREAYRLHKEILPQQGLSISLMYIAKEIRSYKEVESAVVEILQKISAATNSTASDDNSSSDDACAASHYSARNSCTTSQPTGGFWKKIWRGVKGVLSFPFVLLIKFYQVCISPLKPASCRFTPTCSQYAIEAFRKYGPLKGFYLASKRILRCHPWGGSGYDPVP